MQKKILSLILLFASFCVNSFANEAYTKEQIERMISKMVILGFNGETVSVPFNILPLKVTADDIKVPFPRDII